MSDPTETPSADELAEELNELETNAGQADDGAPETAPDPDPAPDAPAEPDPEPAAPAPPEPPAADPKPEAEPTPEPREIAPPTSAQADKKEADAKRRKTVIDSAERPAEAVDPEEEKRKNAIREKMEKVTADRDALLDEAQACQDELTKLSAELYPHAAKSDTLVDAVRGHIKAQKRIRANRQSNPARIAEILKQAGKAPIDAAFHKQRARGMSRPTRTPVTAKAEGEGSSANAGSE